MSNEGYSPDTKAASFNQAFFSQQRLDDLFKRINFCSANPMLMHPIFQCYNYEVIFRDLNSIYDSIRSKFNDQEKKDGERRRNAIEDFLENSPPALKRYDWTGKVKNAKSKEALRILNRLLIDYRNLIEDLMEKYEIGNPNKEGEEGYD